MQLKPPAQWRESITQSIGELLGQRDLEQRLAEIHEVIQRMDQRWDLGFITNEQDYMQQRLKLQQELEQLTPVDTNDLEWAADLLNNFADHWAKCKDDVKAQHDFIKQIVERVYVEDEEVVAMTLKSNCYLVLGHNINGPTEYTVDPFLQNLDSASAQERYMCGPDEIWVLTSPLRGLILPKMIVESYLAKLASCLLPYPNAAPELAFT